MKNTFKRRLTHEEIHRYTQIALEFEKYEGRTSAMNTLSKLFCINPLDLNKIWIMLSAFDVESA